MSIYLGSVSSRLHILLSVAVITALTACTPDAPAGGPTDSDGDGLLDSFECADTADCADTDGDGTPDFQDSDDDNDGLATASELSGGDPVDHDMDGIADHADPDDDGDSLASALENSDGAAAGQDLDGDMKRNALDLDSDGDGMTDELEGRGDEDGDSIPNYLDDDSTPPDQDGDGIPDRLECLDPTHVATCEDSDGDGTADILDTDDDGDGIDTHDELGTGASVLDTDDDGTPNYRDRDDDGDTIPTADEIAASTGGVDMDVDNDGIANWLDSDADGDGIGDGLEGAADTDGDGIPDYLDGGTSGVDSDHDGLPDTLECDDPTMPTACADTDDDGIPDFLDADDDGDSINTSLELSSSMPRDTDADGTPDHRDADDDNDGISTVTEIGDASPSLDTDSDDLPNYRDADDDGDGIATAREFEDGDSFGNDVDNDSIVNWLDADSDADGFADADEARVDTDDDGVPEYLDNTTATGGCSGSVEICGNSTDDDCDGEVDEESFCDVAAVINVQGPPTTGLNGFAWDPSDVTMQVSLQSGATGTLECRTGRVQADGNVGGDFGPCPVGEFTPSTDILTTGDGLYKTQVRLRRSEDDVTDTISLPYYLHASLIDAPDCELGASEADIFAKAAERLPMDGAFSATAATDADGYVQLSNPFIRMNFDLPFNRFFDFGERYPGSAADWALKDGHEQVLSLRRRFVVDSSSGYVLAYRRYASRRRTASTGGGADASTCQVAMVNVHSVFQTNDHRDYCDAVVLNARGAGVCLHISGGTVDFVRTPVNSFSVLVSSMLPADEALVDNVDNALWRKLTFEFSQNEEFVDGSINRRMCLRTHDAYYCGVHGYGQRNGWSLFSPKCYGAPTCVGALISAEMRSYAGAGFYPLFLTDETHYRF